MENEQPLADARNAIGRELLRDYRIEHELPEQLKVLLRRLARESRDRT